MVARIQSTNYMIQRSGSSQGGVDASFVRYVFCWRIVTRISEYSTVRHALNELYY